MALRELPPAEPGLQGMIANMTEPELDLLSRLWEEHMRAPFPPHLRGREIEGEDVVLLDADIALGFPAALLAGPAGAAGLASTDVRVPATLVALASAGFAAGAGFLRSDTRRRANKRARHAWASVEARAMVALTQEHVPTGALATCWKTARPRWRPTTARSPGAWVVVIRSPSAAAPC